MKLSLALSRLFTASFLWRQGFSLTLEASTNEGKSSERQADVESYRHPVKDVGSTTLENNTTKGDISVVQKSRSLQTMLKNWVQLGDTVTSDGSESLALGDDFGASIALNKKGTRLVVGAPTANPVGDTGEYDGKIEIYDLINSEWNLVQTIFGVPGTIDGWKGKNVSITPKGNHIAVQNHGNMANGGSFSVYERDNTTGQFSQLGSTISEVSTNGQHYNSFGSGIDMSYNGKRVALGSPYSSTDMEGKAYVYEYDSAISEWGIIFEMTGGVVGQVQFGSDVSFAGNGKSIAVVAGGLPSTVHVFEEDSSSSTWIQSSIPLTDPLYVFKGVAMSKNGMRIAVADSNENAITSTYVFDKVGPNWEMNDTTPLMGYGTGDPSSIYGKRVAISPDGTKVVVTSRASMFPDTYEGNAIIYEEDTLGVWSQVGDIIVKSPSITGSVVNSVAIADIGGRKAATMVAVGSRRVYSTDGPIGSAEVYTLKSIPCVDSVAEMRMLDTMTMDEIPFFCKWVNKGQGSTCGEFGLLKDHCPDSCGTCADYGCSDSMAAFIVTGSETSCTTLSGYDQTLVDVLCKNKKIRTSCRGTCGYCG